jgi:NAD+ kinase
MILRHGAGGSIMPLRSEDLQYMVREHLTEDQSEHNKLGHGLIKSDEMMNIRWNSQFGCVYVDGSHLKHDLELGDEIKIDGHAPYLKIFES